MVYFISTSTIWYPESHPVIDSMRSNQHLVARIEPFGRSQLFGRRKISKNMNKVPMRNGMMEEEEVLNPNA
jgi:hypothetical protein